MKGSVGPFRQDVYFVWIAPRSFLSNNLFFDYKENPYPYINFYFSGELLSVRPCTYLYG